MDDIASDPEIEAALLEMQRDGTLIREKSRLLVETWLDKIYPRMVSTETSSATLIEIGKVLIELGDLKPKKDLATGPVGPSFSITIQLPDNPTPITIRSDQVSEEAEYTEVSNPVAEELATTGEMNFNLPSFPLNSDLYGGTSAEPQEDGE